MASFDMAANMYGMFPNTYYNQVALNDLTGLDLFAPMGMNPMINPMMSMNGSIFPTMPGMMMPGYGGNFENYYQNYDKYQDFMINNQIRQQQRMRQADLRLNSPQEGIQKQATYLHEKIMRNEQQQIQQAYANFKESVRSLYGSDATEEQIANRASTLYKQITGVSISDDIRQYGRGSFTQGLLQTLTFGFADKKTAEENISELTGQPVGRSENAKKIAGNIVGGAVVGGGVGISAKYLLKAFCAGAKNKTFWAALIGGTAGLLTALGTANIGKS